MHLFLKVVRSCLQDLRTFTGGRFGKNKRSIPESEELSEVQLPESRCGHLVGPWSW